MSRLLKNAHLDHLGTDFKSVPPFPFAVQRTRKYASRLGDFGGLASGHPVSCTGQAVEQPAKKTFFNML